jgi:DNA-3-methyladenine glycosylase II
MDDPRTYLARCDPVMASLIDAHGAPPSFRALPSSQRFDRLARSIVYQQLAGNAAAAIHGRFVASLGGVVTPEAILAADPSVLAASGLSGAKAASLLDLADKVASGQVVLDRIGRLSDEAIVEHLCQVRGIGPWTADMFLLWVLGRKDVWPVGDYGVRAGFARAWGLEEIPSSKELAALGDPFRPYRGVVAWYCWRVMDDRSVS